MTAPLPDRLAFCCDALAARGALVEPTDNKALALLPPELGSELQVADACTLAVDAAPSEVGVEFGAPLLERLVDGARATKPLVLLVSENASARVSQARSLAERWVLRNGVHEFVEALPRTSVYSVVWFLWSAEGDDRYEGLVRLVLSERDGGEPDPTFLADFDGITLSSGVAEAPLDAPSATDCVEYGRRFAARAALRVRDSLTPVLATVRRRYERDHERTTEYFAGLVREARTAAARRRIDGAALAEKITHFVAERDAKLGDLAERFALRVSLTPAAAARIRVPTAQVRVRARRRKLDRELELALPAGAAAFDALPCDGCAGAAAKPALCDERLHVLCTDCVPDAQGRFRCPACARPPPVRPGRPNAESG